MERKKKKISKKQIVALILIFALLISFAWCVIFYRYYYYEFYGFVDGLRISETWILKRAKYSEDELYDISIVDDENGSGATFSSCLWLVNTEYLLDASKEIDLIAVNDNHSITAEAYDSLLKLFEACFETTGERLSITSSFRTFEKQEAIYAVNQFAVPAGASEHQCGLAVDVRTERFASVNFIKSEAGKWLARHAHEYGFIIRYPYWGEDETGVTYEPWHLRYVGEPHATIIYRTRSVLEEYASLYKYGEFYYYDGYIISHQTGEGGTLSFLSNTKDVFVSEDNMGGYFIWGKKN